MTFSIGIDIGGTKIAGTLFDKANKELTDATHPTPNDYSALVTTTVSLIEQLSKKTSGEATIGIGVPGVIQHTTGVITVAANIACLTMKPFKADIEKALKRPVHLANDADCATLSEAEDGAGKGFKTVFGLILGTGVGGGFVSEGRLVQGANGLTGEIGQLPLPHRQTSDGPLFEECICGQEGCIDKTISGLGLARMYQFMTGQELDARAIATAARQNDPQALKVLDQYYTTVAKAMVTVIHSYDPHIIVVSGGLYDLPKMCEEVPKRWGHYTMQKNLKTKMVRAQHGATSGIRGAAFVGKQGGLALTL